MLLLSNLFCIKKERKKIKRSFLCSYFFSFFQEREKKESAAWNVTIFVKTIKNFRLMSSKILDDIYCNCNFFSQKLAETRAKVKKSLADDMDTVRAFDAVLELIALGNKELQTKPQVVRSSYK